MSLCKIYYSNLLCAIEERLVKKRRNGRQKKESTHTIFTYRLSLLVLASVQHSPIDLSRVPLGQEGRLTLGIQKLEHLLNKF